MHHYGQLHWWAWAAEHEHESEPISAGGKFQTIGETSMPEQYQPEHLFTEKQAEAHSILSLHGREAPPRLQGERLESYDRRLTDMVAQTSPKFKDVNLRDAGSATYPILKRQVYEDSHQEALHPTNIPEGTLREVKRLDPTGRPFVEFYGRPRTWLDQFASPRKRLAGIFSPGARTEEFR
jgi:hypothetical protein